MSEWVPAAVLPVDCVWVPSLQLIQLIFQQTLIRTQTQCMSEEMKRRPVISFIRCHAAVWAAGVEGNTWQMRSVNICWCGHHDEKFPATRRDTIASVERAWPCQDRSDALPTCSQSTWYNSKSLFIYENQIFNYFFWPKCMPVHHITQGRNAHFCHVYTVLFNKSYPSDESWETMLLYVAS